MHPDLSTLPDRRFSSIMNFISEALNPRKVITSLKGIFEDTGEKTRTVDLRIADYCHFANHISSRSNFQELVTVVYDQESLDSLYGLSFFVHLFGNRVQAIPCQNALLQKNNFAPSDQTFIVGVDLSMDDLVSLDRVTGHTWVLAYRGSHDYLYEQSNHDKFRHVSLFMADYAFNIGGENIEQFENTMATMIATLFFDHPSYQTWGHRNLRKQVAHATTMYATIPDYGLSKSKLVVREVADDKKTVILLNRAGAQMLSLRNKLEAAIAEGDLAKMNSFVPQLNMTDYTVRRKRMVDHIARTSALQAWRRKKGGTITCNTITGSSADAHDLMEVATFSKSSVICVEDVSGVVNYYIYSTTPGRAADLAAALKGDRHWRRGQIYCVQVNKAQTDRR